MALIFLAGALGGFAAGVIACNVRDIKDLHEMEQILTEGHDRLVKEIEQKNRQIEMMSDKEEINA